MPPKSMPWCRWYSETPRDPKIKKAARLANASLLETLGFWGYVLAVANDSPVRGELLISADQPYGIDDLAASCELPIGSVEKLIDAFIKLGMLHFDQDVIVVTNFLKRNYESDNSSLRVDRYRAKREDNGLKRTSTYSTSEIVERYHSRCVYCGSTENLVVDHAFPINQGGTDDPDNLVCACKRCNSGKAGRTPEQAGYTFIDKDAELAYRRYMSRPVTVTVTPSESDTESDTDTDLIEVEEGGSLFEHFEDVPTDKQVFLGKVTRGFSEKFQNEIQINILLHLRDQHGEDKTWEALSWYAAKGVPLGEAISRAEKALPNWGKKRPVLNASPPSPPSGGGARRNGALSDDYQAYMAELRRKAEANGNGT